MPNHFRCLARIIFTLIVLGDQSSILWAKSPLPWKQYLMWHTESQDKAVAGHEIVHWRPLGSRWALGLDQQLTPLVLVDLSLPVGKNGKKGEMLLHEHRSEAVATKAHGKNQSNNNAPQFFSSLESVQKAQKWTELLALDNQGMIPWQSTRQAGNKQQQRMGTLEAVNWSEVLGANKQTKFFAQWKQLLWLLASTSRDHHAIPLTLNQFFQQFGWRQVPSEAKTVFYYQSSSTQKAEIFTPQTLVDFRAPRSTYLQAVKWELAEDLFSKILKTLGPTPVAALLEVTIGNFLRFQGKQLLVHQNMLTAFLWEMLDRNPYFPSFQLGPTQLARALEALYFVDGQDGSLYHWALREVSRSWQKNKQRAESLSTISRRQFLALGNNYQSVTPYFVRPTNSSEWYLLGAFSKPILALPHGSRNWVGYWETILRGSGYFIPFPWYYFQSFLLELYQRIWSRPSWTAQFWECRFKAIVEQLYWETRQVYWKELAEQIHHQQMYFGQGTYQQEQQQIRQFYQQLAIR